MVSTVHAKKLAAITEAEFDNFGGFHETTPQMAGRIKKYWTGLGLDFPGVGTAWSAVFVSFHVMKAGASAAEFKFSPRHGVFVRKAIANSAQGVGLFRGRRLQDYSPKLGDIIQNNRNGNKFDFQFAAQNDAYESHSAIVVEEGIDGNGRYVRTVGGNESDTVGEKVVRLNSQGLIRQPAADPTRFICVIENLK